MSDKKYTWHKVAESLNELEFADNKLTILEVAGKRICIGLQGDKLYGCASRCPHSGGILAMGYIDATGNIVCPTHHYKFSLANGHNVSGEGYCLKVYPVEQRADGIFVGFEAKGLFGWLK